MTEGLSYNQTIWDIGAAVCLPLERSHKKCLSTALKRSAG